MIIPAVVGRKYTGTAPQYPRKNCIIRPGTSKDKLPAVVLPQNGDEYDVIPGSSDSVSSTTSSSLPCLTHKLSKFDTKLAIITVSLRDRMRFYKLRVTPNAATIASTFNEQFKPEIITTDPNSIEWIDENCPDKVVVGENVGAYPSSNRHRWLTHDRLCKLVILSRLITACAGHFTLLLSTRGTTIQSNYC